jgi:hypothetical protein
MIARLPLGEITWKNLNAVMIISQILTLILTPNFSPPLNQIFYDHDLNFE